MEHTDEKARSTAMPAAGGASPHAQSRAADTGSSAGSGASGTDAIRDAGADIARDLRAAGAEQGRAALDKVRDGADQALAGVGDKAAERVDSLAGAARDIGRSLKDHDQPALGRFADDAASSIGAISERLRHGSVEQLMSEAQRLARSNPGLFVVGSVAIGFGLARFLKASDPGGSGSHASTSDSEYGVSGDASRAAASTSQRTFGGQHGY